MTTREDIIDAISFTAMKTARQIADDANAPLPDVVKELRRQMRDGYVIKHPHKHQYAYDNATWETTE